MTVERIHPKAPVMLIFIAIFTCLPSCINLSNISHILLILIFLVSKSPYPSIVYFIEESEHLVEPNSHICKTNE